MCFADIDTGGRSRFRDATGRLSMGMPQGSSGKQGRSPGSNGPRRVALSSAPGLDPGTIRMSGPSDMVRQITNPGARRHKQTISGMGQG